MAHVVEFRASSRRNHSRSASLSARGSAQIVIFPGVRYERWDDGTAAGAMPHSRTRDRIDLPE